METVTEYKISHGTAVAMGMIMANSISVRRGMLKSQTARKYEELLMQVIHIDSALIDKPIDDFIGAMKKDKKQIDTSLTIVLMTDKAGELRIVHDATTDEAAYAFDYFRKIYSGL